MQPVIPNLYATPAEPLPFAPDQGVRAFLLRRDQDNLLVYSAPTAAAEVSAIEELGGVSRQYLNHWHEAAFGGLEAVVGAIGAPVFAHEEEREHVGKVSPVETFSERASIGDDFELIPTPGHTPGATAFLWDSGDHRVLFTGDSIYLRDGEWVAAVLESSDRAAYIESLELLRELDFDVLVPWVVGNDQPIHALTGGADARRRIDAILERVRGGADS
jgi:glyoxylase-like metal-dependent hydrolase (beta-lactamase superfamily II)